jgi:hemerythrin-like metal-binding protein
MSAARTWSQTPQGKRIRLEVTTVSADRGLTSLFATAWARIEEMAVDPKPFPISIIDEEHRGIQRAVVELMEAILLGAGAATVLEAAQQVLQVTQQHFKHEEMMLRQIRFPKLKEHRDDHARIDSVLERIIEELKGKQSSSALRSLREYRRLLLVHLQNEDEQYREAVNRYAAEHGTSPLPPRIRHTLPKE